MKPVPLTLTAVATAGVVAIAGMMAKDRWDRWQLEKALKRQRTLESFEQGCRGETFSKTPAGLALQRQSCEWWKAMLLGDEAVAELKRKQERERMEDLGLARSTQPQKVTPSP